MAVSGSATHCRPLCAYADWSQKQSLLDVHRVDKTSACINSAGGILAHGEPRTPRRSPAPLAEYATCLWSRAKRGRSASCLLAVLGERLDGEGVRDYGEALGLLLPFMAPCEHPRLQHAAFDSLQRLAAAQGEGDTLL